MNALLIYNDNISSKLIKEFEEKGGIAIDFNIGNQDLANPNFSFDNTVSEKLESIENKQFDVIFLPFSLSEENYIEFLGIQFSYHIRLTPNFNNIYTPIVFFGNETPEIINKITSQGVILFTPGIYCTQKSTVNDFEKQLNFIKSKKPAITKEEYKTFLEKINVIPPANYATHHSITNEWSILRWAKTLNVNDDDDILKIESKIGSSLYYKYLNAKYPILESNKISDSELLIKNKGRVLYLDDEAEKGWSELFSELLFTKCELKEFDGELGYDFKGKEKKEIIHLSFEKVKEFNPDVVILDLRLHDDDFETQNPKEISGYQILRKIKEYNNGIQVIIFSATNKIWNLLELQNEGADGFILKEAPELSVDKNFTKDSIKNIINTIDKCLEYSFLTDFYSKYKEMKQELLPRTNPKNAEYPLDKKFVNEYLKWLKFGIDNIGKFKNKEGFVTSFLILFSVLENLSNRIIDIDNPESVFINNETKYQYKFRINDKYLKFFECNDDVYSSSNKNLVSLKSINWNQKILNALDFLSGYELNFPNINNIIRKRNDIIHSNTTTGNNIEISIDEIKKLFYLITNNINNLK
ncbi:response regulator [Flavobacterium sp. RSSA_27]|uniref:response regulator n=1 Tax=Flavobacterium sp. RSSA_27 TaxID=3447667 RepID=UPI003F36349D